MRHPSKVHVCSGPEDEHAYDLIPEAIRSGNLDEKCPTCHGHGEWNLEIDLISFRSKRVICEHCYGSGWIETGHDLVAIPDIVMSPLGYPMWIRRYIKPHYENSEG